jgi:hypothetical protein
VAAVVKLLGLGSASEKVRAGSSCACCALSECGLRRSQL